MIRIEDKDLENITGGATPYIWVGIAVAALVIFLSGFIDGLVNPKKCGE